MDLNSTAKDIIKAVGGEENIETVGNCMTRLRFTLKDQTKVNVEAISKIKVIKGTSKGGGQYQLIVGSEYASDLGEAVNKLGTFTQMEGSIKKQVHILDIIVDTMSGSVVPLIGVLVGAAMINVIVSIAGICGADTSVGTWVFFSNLASAASNYLPVFVGYCCAKKIGANPFFGLFVGAVMCYPALASAIGAENGLKLFGITLNTTSYTGTIIPVILSVVFMKYVEKFAKRYVPKVIAIFTVPTVVFVITLPIAYLVLGPVGTFITNLITSAVMFLMEHAGFLAVGIFAAVLPVCVMSGIHVSMIVIYYASVTAYGADIIFFPSFMCYNIAIAGIALAVALKSKNTDLKSLGVSCCISGLFGITEPTLFGICLRFKKQFYALIAACGISGIITYLVGYKVSVPIAQSIFSIPAAAGLGSGNVTAAAISFACAFVCGFIISTLFGFEDPHNA